MLLDGWLVYTFFRWNRRNFGNVRTSQVNLPVQSAQSPHGELRFRKQRPARSALNFYAVGHDDDNINRNHCTIPPANRAYRALCAAKHGTFIYIPVEMDDKSQHFWITFSCADDFYFISSSFRFMSSSRYPCLSTSVLHSLVLPHYISKLRLCSSVRLRF